MSDNILSVRAYTVTGSKLNDTAILEVTAIVNGVRIDTNLMFRASMLPAMIGALQKLHEGVVTGRGRNFESIQEIPAAS